MLALWQQRMGELPWLALVAVASLCLAWPLRARFSRLVRLRSAPAAARSVVTDLAFVWISPVTELLTRVATSTGFVLCAVALGRQADPTWLSGFGPLSRQPLWLQVIEMLVVGDLIYYWTHRMAHTVPWLWRLHAVHHSSEHMTPTSALRSHPLEAYVLLLNHVPLFALGFPVDVLPALVPFTTLYAMWIHAPSRVSLRRLSFLFNSPHFHRWHHARQYPRGGVNFAGLFPFFDFAFGTYHLPAAAPRAVGVEEPMPADLVGQLLHPFGRPASGVAPGAARGRGGASVANAPTWETWTSRPASRAAGRPHPA